MIKTQIQIEEWQYEAIKRESAREDRRMSDFIREAVTVALQKRGAKPSLSAIAGKYEPIDAEELKPHDRFWVEGIRR